MNAIQTAIRELKLALESKNLAKGLALEMDIDAYSYLQQGSYMPDLVGRVSGQVSFWGIPIKLKDMRPRKTVTVNGVKYMEMLEGDNASS